MLGGEPKEATMASGYIEKSVRRASRNLLISSIIILGGVIGMAGLTWRYYLNYFAGPSATSVQEVVNARSADALTRYFVTLQGDRVVPTGFTHVTKQVSKYTRREVSRSTDAVYLAMLLGGRILLVKADKETEEMKVTGYLTDFDDNVDRQVVQRLRQQAPPGRAADILPLMLDATGFRTRGTIGLVAFGLFGLIGALNLRACFRRRRDRTRHPIWQRLAKLGDAPRLAGQIDAEMAEGSSDLGGGLKLTRAFLLRPSAFGLTIMPFEHLVWVYKKVTKHKKAFVTVSKTYDAVVIDRTREKLEVTMKELAVDNLIGALEERAPWVVIGWSAELERAWNKQPAEVIAFVDQRRREPVAAAPVEAAPQAPAPAAD
jgi:hypothetical protein